MQYIYNIFIPHPHIFSLCSNCNIQDCPFVILVTANNIISYFKLFPMFSSTFTTLNTVGNPSTDLAALQTSLNAMEAAFFDLLLVSTYLFSCFLAPFLHIISCISYLPVIAFFTFQINTTYPFCLSHKILIQNISVHAPKIYP